MARPPWYRRALPWPGRPAWRRHEGSERHDEPETPETFLLWFGFLGGAASWLLHLVIAYGISEIACHSDRLAFSIAGLPAGEFLGYGATLLAALTALTATYVAFALRPEGVVDQVEQPGSIEAEGRSRFMAYTGIVMSGLFTLAILAGGLGFFFLNPCAG